MKIKVASDKCIGCGNCVGLTDGKVFDFNDEGLAEVKVEEVPEDLVGTVEEAMEQCPTGAIEK